MNSTTVWAYTTGSYSDYAVDCLFVRREDALAYGAAMHNATAADLDEFLSISQNVTNKTRDRYNQLERLFDDDVWIEPFQLWDGVPIVTKDDR